MARDDPDQRRPLNALLTGDGYAGLYTFARAHHVSMTGLLDGIGVWVGDLDQPTARLPAWLREAIRHGQDLDEQRRRRR